MKIQILANDKAKKGFLSEHGLAININHPLYKILFDSGNTDVYLDNAKRMNVNLNDINYIVLSHGHYDHTGGLQWFPHSNTVKQVIIHKDAFFPKYKKENYLKYNGMPYRKETYTWFNNTVNEVTGFNLIAPSFYVLGNIEHKSRNDKFYLAGSLDDFHDEIILILEEDNELSLFMGCSHYGVINGIEAVKKQLPNKRIKNVIAGMHLGEITIKEYSKIGDYLEKLNLDKLIPIHCTGDRAENYFKERFKETCYLLGAGDELDI